MTISKLSEVPFGTELKLKELKELMSESEWAKFEQDFLSPEEAELLLSETDWIDIDEVNQLLGMSESESASFVGSRHASKSPVDANKPEGEQ